MRTAWGVAGSQNRNKLSMSVVQNNPAILLVSQSDRWALRKSIIIGI
jgi:hypothetical protein